MDTREGIKALLAISWLAAYLQSLFPVWVRSFTPRQAVTPHVNAWKVHHPKAYEEFRVTEPVPPFMEAAPTIDVELTEHRIGVHGVSKIFDGQYHIGLGFGYFGPKYGGIVFYWTERWVKAELDDMRRMAEWWNYGRA